MFRCRDRGITKTYRAERPCHRSVINEERKVNYLYRSGQYLATASQGNPVTSTATVMLFYCIFVVIEATVESLLFGERFEHWLDVIFQIMFMAYSAYSVYACALFNSIKDR